MANPRTAATVFDTVAQLRADRGPETVRYVFVAELGATFVFTQNSNLTDDGRTVIGVTGGNFGAWLLVRDSDRGADLTDADMALNVGDGAWRVLPAATLSTTRTLTLSTTNAAEGDEIEVTRFDVTANTVPIVNGGVGGGTLVTLPVSVKSFARFAFDGTNWSVRESALML